MKPYERAESAPEWVRALRDAVEGGGDRLPTVRVRGLATHSDSTIEAALGRFSRAPIAVREEVIAELGQEPDGTAVKALARMARWGSEWRLRVRIVEALAGGRGEAAIEALADIARDDPDEDVRAAAITKLADRARSGLAGGETGSHVRGAVRVRGGPTGGPSSEAADIVDMIRRAQAFDRSPVVRAAAAEALTESGQ